MSGAVTLGGLMNSSARDISLKMNIAMQREALRENKTLITCTLT